MLSVLAALALSAAPTILRVDMQDALRFPSGMETPPADPLIIFIKAPASWAQGGAISEAGKKAVLARLYGGPEWMNGNSDGSTYVVKSFKSRVLAAGEKPAEGPHTFWYEVKAEGTLDKRGADFGAPEAPKTAGSFIDHAEPGSVFKPGPAVADAKALLDWLGKQTVLVKLPVVLKKGQVGFVGRGAKVGTTEILADDSTLGVSLADRARDACEDAPTCTLFLIGKWKGGKERVFQVTKVDGAINGAMREMGMDKKAWVQGE